MEKYTERLSKIWDWMAEEGISLLMLEDTETRRDQNIRYLTGHPADALLFLSIDRKAVLVAWDVNLAKMYASQSPVMYASYNDFGRQPRKAIAAVAQMLDISAGAKIEIPSVTPYPLFLDYVGELSNFDILCRENGAAVEFRKLRTVKDEEEIAITRKAAAVTNELIDLLEENVKSTKIKTEADAALFIQADVKAQVLKLLPRGRSAVSRFTLFRRGRVLLSAGKGFQFWISALNTAVIVLMLPSPLPAI